MTWTQLEDERRSGIRIACVSVRGAHNRKLVGDIYGLPEAIVPHHSVRLYLIARPRRAAIVGPED
eukprot:scaffold4801_cov115-Pinguiococcus_pyrenoidosus.AAC.1